ncbi:MAG: hypothetical protein SFU86_14370 [Pirellulaceae bacterium]|nr:hypothetical protein [Pirellulaceae bacterium]
MLRWSGRILLTLALLVGLTFGGVLCFAPGPQRRAAGLFGGLAMNVRNKPDQTAAICLVSLATLWSGVALLAGGQAVAAQFARRRDGS